MSLPKVNNFICVCSLKFGSQVASWIENIASFVIFVTSSSIFFQNYNPSAHHLIFFIAIYMMLSLIHLMVTAYLTLGVYTNCVKYVKAWLYCAMVSMILYPIIIVLHAAGIFLENNMSGGCTLLGTTCLLLLLHFYFIVVIRSYLDEIVFGQLEDMS